MALNVGQITVGTAGTDQIALPSSVTIGVRFRNVGDVTVYLGSTSGFSTANGYPIQPGEEFSYNNEAGVTIYFRAATGSGSVAYFYVS